VDIFGNGACDLSLNLTERVLTREVDGKMQIEGVPEPELPDDYWTGR